MVAPIMNDALTAQTVELLQQMIRNQCVNDGTIESGQEVRTTDLLRTYLEGSGLDLEVYEPDGAPGRANLVARIEGSDPTAPTLCLMGHTDVVPVTPATWTRDPFGGELIKGEVWGRGAVDMLNLTASQAVALKAWPGRDGGRGAPSCTSPVPTRKRAACSGPVTCASVTGTPSARTISSRRTAVSCPRTVAS
jgi:Acetylornithine deacetylase/Succinyl-diaminopimelate desuccinylase and related deacylases